MAVKKLAKSGKWATANTWTPEGAPVASDEVDLSGSSFNLEIGTAVAKCRSLVAGTYKGTLSMTTGVLNIGDATAGPGNVALEFGAEMTFTSESGSGMSFVSTSATQQTIKYAGKKIPNTKWEGIGSSYLLLDKLEGIDATTALTHKNGTLNFGGQEVVVGQIKPTGSAARTLNIEGSTVKLLVEGATPWDNTTTTNQTLLAAGSTVEVNGAVAQPGGAPFQFIGGGKTYGTLVAKGGAGVPAVEVTGANTFSTLANNTGAATTAAEVKTTNGSKAITKVSGTLLVGQEIVGAGIPAGTVLLTETELSANATATGTVSVTLRAPGLLLKAAVVQTVTTLTSNGTSSAKARLASSTAGSRHKIKSDGQVIVLKNTVIKDSEAEGTSQFWAGEGCTLENSTGWKEGEPAKPVLHGGGRVTVTGDALHQASVQTHGGGRTTVVSAAVREGAPQLHGGGHTSVAGDVLHRAAIEAHAGGRVQVSSATAQEGVVRIHGGGLTAVTGFEQPQAAVTVHAGGLTRVAGFQQPQSAISLTAGGLVRTGGFQQPTGTPSVRGGGRTSVTSIAVVGGAVRLHGGGLTFVEGRKVEILVVMTGGGRVRVVAQQKQVPASIEIVNMPLAVIEITDAPLAEIEITPAPWGVRVLEVV